MRLFSLNRILICLLGLLLLAGCVDTRLLPADEDNGFVVNGRIADSEFHPSADVQTLRFEVYAENKWDCVQEGFERRWISYEIAKAEKKNTWKIAIILAENTGISPRTAVFLFTSGKMRRRVTVTQSVEDPIFRTHTLGAYGIPGGDVIFERGRSQYSRLHYGTDRLSFRLLEPASTRVVTLNGLPRHMEPGMQFPVLFRILEGGYTRMSESYEVQVIRVRESLVWLKKDDDTYFVVKE